MYGARPCAWARLSDHGSGTFRLRTSVTMLQSLSPRPKLPVEGILSTRHHLRARRSDAHVWPAWADHARRLTGRLASSRPQA